MDDGRVTTADSGFLKIYNPAAVLDGRDIQMRGLVKVRSIDGAVAHSGGMGTVSKNDREIRISGGHRVVTLEGSFNHLGKVFVYQADLELDVNVGSHYYPVAGFEINAGKVWMWLQDEGASQRASDRIEARLLKSFKPVEEDFMDIVEYASVIDPEVLEERRAICDNPNVAGYTVDESMDRGDLAYGDRSDN